LPLAVAGGLDAEQHIMLARALLEVGWLLDDPAPFRCSAHEAWTAIELAALTGAQLPAAYALAGEALLAAEEHGQVAELLGPAVSRFGDDLPARSRLHLGLAKAALDEPAVAAELLQDFARRDPSSPAAAWASDHARWLADYGGEGVRALLIGVGKLEGLDMAPLPGPANDVRLIHALLVGELEIPQDRIVALVDEAATHDAVLQEFSSLAGLSTDCDTVVVYFSGHSDSEASAGEPYLFT
jgi:Caspase domain